MSAGNILGEVGPAIKVYFGAKPLPELCGQGGGCCGPESGLLVFSQSEAENGQCLDALVRLTRPLVLGYQVVGGSLN